MARRRGQRFRYTSGLKQKPSINRTQYGISVPGNGGGTGGSRSCAGYSARACNNLSSCSWCSSERKCKPVGQCGISAPGNAGGNRSMHFHSYPQGPYGPSGHAIPPLGWGVTYADGSSEVIQQFDPYVQEHWGQYPGGYSYQPDPGGPHTGYMHSSTTHNHDGGPGMPPPSTPNIYRRGGKVRRYHSGGGFPKWHNLAHRARGKDYHAWSNPGSSGQKNNMQHQISSPPTNNQGSFWNWYLSNPQLWGQYGHPDDGGDNPAGWPCTICCNMVGDICWCDCKDPADNYLATKSSGGGNNIGGIGQGNAPMATIPPDAFCCGSPNEMEWCCPKGGGAIQSEIQQTKKMIQNNPSLANGNIPSDGDLMSWAALCCRLLGNRSCCIKAVAQELSGQ